MGRVKKKKKEKKEKMASGPFSISSLPRGRLGGQRAQERKKKEKERNWSNAFPLGCPSPRVRL